MSNVHREPARATISYTTVQSPVGSLLLAGDDDALRVIHFVRDRDVLPLDAAWEEKDTALLRETRRQLDEYFSGQRRRFQLPLAPSGSTFQQRVWRALLEVPYGTTCSYADLARRLGDLRATRAVGAANGRNPIPIVVPCHRVIGADGSLIGYGGGLDVKRYLLSLEGALPHRDLFTT
jgi:methylated-DNA-[protein]-cysteine S-methyltransferase